MRETEDGRRKTEGAALVVAWDCGSDGAGVCQVDFLG